MDLDAYLTRIRDPAPADRSPTLATLQRLQRAHATAIPFENLDIHLGRSIAIDLDAVFAKLVTGRRGGYCFEQNLLFATALDQLGFGVTRLAARVRIGGTVEGPRTHMTLAVSPVDRDERWLADAGFGGAGALGPVPMVPGGHVTHGVWHHRLERDGEQWVLQVETADRWLDLYAFTEEPQLPSDYEVANHYTSTHPSSGFVLALTAQLPGDEYQLVLRGDQLSEYRPGGVTTTEMAGPDEILAILRDRFSLDFPAGTRFRSPGVERSAEFGDKAADLGD